MDIYIGFAEIFVLMRFALYCLLLQRRLCAIVRLFPFSPFKMYDVYIVWPPLRSIISIAFMTIRYTRNRSLCGCPHCAGIQLCSTFRYTQDNAVSCPYSAASPFMAIVWVDGCRRTAPIFAFLLSACQGEYKRAHHAKHNTKYYFRDMLFILRLPGHGYPVHMYVPTKLPRKRAAHSAWVSMHTAALSSAHAGYMFRVR